MEQIRIDRRDRRLRARARAGRPADPQPLRYRAGDDPAVDEDLLSRIEALVDHPGRTDDPAG